MCGKTDRTSRLAITLLTTTFAMAWSLSARQIITNWVAYNDHRPGPLIPPHVPIRTNWGTALRVTTYDMGAPGNTTGTLTNYLNGQPLPVTVTFTRQNAPDDFGTVSSFGPLTNSPAGQLFFGICDLSTNGIVGVDALDGDVVTITINGLNPEKRFTFRGTSARGGGYAARWSVATINALDWIDAHINGLPGTYGVITSNDFPNLGPGQAAWNSGDNVEGDVIGWDFIKPAPDGSFSIVVAQYVGPYYGGSATDANYGYSFGAMLLAEVEATAPVVTTNPPPQTTVEQNRPFSLSVAALGTPLLYQWYKQTDGAIAGATFPTYSVSRAALGDAGDYYAVVYNPLGRATSTVAQVTVNADVTPPSVASAFCYPSFDPGTQVATVNQIMVEFSETVDPRPLPDGTTLDPANYTISDGNSPASVVLTNDRTVALLLSTPLAEDTVYTVSIEAVADLVGNVIQRPGPNNPASFRTWAPGPGNGLLFEAFNAGAGVDVVTLTSSPNFPNHPFLRTNLWTFESRAVFPDDSYSQYGSRIQGVFIPPVSGDWVFFLRTYDRGEVYLNPNGLDAAGATLVVAETTGNEPRDWNKFISTPFPLRGGQGYYIESLQKADTGTDAIKVAARLAGTGFPTLGVPIGDLDTNALTGTPICFPLAPRDLGGVLTLVQDLADVTAEENHAVTLSVQVSNPSGLPIFYQWRRDGLDIPGANGPTYSLVPTLADDGAVFSVRASKIGAVLTSANATLTVVPDTTPPVVVEVHGSYLLNQVVVSFSESMKSDPLGGIPDTANFRIDDGAGFSVLSAAVDVTGTNILLTVDPPLAPAGVYSLQVESTIDVAGNPNDSTNVPLRAFVFSQGFLRLDYFGGLSTTDNALDSTLLADPRYPNAPEQRFFLTAFDTRTVFPTDAREGYGARVTGLFTPPVTGNYIFYLRSDDSSRLFLNPTGPDPAGATMIVEEMTCCRAFSVLPSAPQALTAGQSYAVEALLKEGTSSDYVQVAVKLDSDPTDPDTLLPIPGSRLSTLADPVGASLTITQQPSGVLVTRLPATNTFLVGARSTFGGLPNTNLIAYQWQRDEGAGLHDIPGATGQALTVVVGTRDKPADFRCLVFSPGAAAVTSDVAALTVPNLSIRQDATMITVSWPLTVRAAGFVLEFKSDLAAGSWDPVPTGSYQTNGGVVLIEVALPPTAPGAFYRLRRP